MPKSSVHLAVQPQSPAGSIGTGLSLPSRSSIADGMNLPAAISMLITMPSPCILLAPERRWVDSGVLPAGVAQPKRAEQRRAEG